MPGLYLSQLLLRESKESETAANELSKPIAKSLELAFSKKLKSNQEPLILKEDNSTTSSGPTADSVRAETVKNLVKSISDHLGSDTVAAEVAESLLRVLSSCLPSAPSVSAELTHQLSRLLLSPSHHLSSTTSSSLLTRLGPHCPVLVEAIRLGHLELLPLLQTHPLLLLPAHTAARFLPSVSSKAQTNSSSTTSEATQLMARQMHTLLVAVGLAPLVQLLAAVAEKDARGLLLCVPSLVLELESSSSADTQQMVLDLLLAAALADPAVVAKHLPPILAVLCPLVAPQPPSPVPSCSLPLLKLLAAVGVRSRDEAVTTQCLAAVARAARRLVASEKGSEQLGAAVLEALNVLKDRSKFCNVFHNDTIAALGGLKEHNEHAFDNLIRWNRGKKAWKGNLEHFLLTGGQPSLLSPLRPHRWYHAWWGSSSSGPVAVAPMQPPTPKRPSSAPSPGPTTLYKGRSSSANGSAVAPSPLFNHGDTPLLTSPPPAEVAKNLFGETSTSTSASSQYVSFSEFIARQKSLSAGERPGSAATVTAGYQGQKSDSLALPSVVGGEAEEKSVGHIRLDG